MDLITFGESMVLFNPDLTGPLRYVNNFRKSLAGAESNVAIGLSRLGHKVGWFSKLGDDEFGRYMLSVIRGEGVDVSNVVTDSKNPTGILFKERFSHVNPNVYYYRKHSAASNLMPGELNEDYIKNAKILHVTGISLALSEKMRKSVFKAIKIAKDNGVLISFDPNIRLKLWPLEEAAPVILEVARLSDIILPGVDEAELLIEVKDPEEIAKAFIEMGCSTVAVKLGKDGCYVSHKDESHFVPGYKVEKVEDTVGAGDGFAAGFLSGVIRDLNLFECAEYANGVGAMATLVSGDMEGLPTWQQLMEFTGKAKHIDR